MEHGNKAEHEFEIHVHVSRRKKVCSRTSLSKELLYKSPTWILSFCQSKGLRRHNFGADSDTDMDSDKIILCRVLVSFLPGLNPS